MSVYINGVAENSHISQGLEVNRPTYPRVGDIYLCVDTRRFCSCTEEGVWISVELA